MKKTSKYIDFSAILSTVRLAISGMLGAVCWPPACPSASRSSPPRASGWSGRARTMWGSWSSISCTRRRAWAGFPTNFHVFQGVFGLGIGLKGSKPAMFMLILRGKSLKRLRFRHVSQPRQGGMCCGRAPRRPSASRGFKRP